MNHLAVNQVQVETINQSRASQSESAEVFADIYQEDINICIWQRRLSSDLLQAAERVISSNHAFRFSSSVTPQGTYESLYSALGANAEAQIISTDVSEIVDMFCYLFDLDQVGLRLTTLDRAMCPKFHVDRVPCRLVTTYSGIATEWLSHQDVDREKLGAGSQGKSDDKSGLYIDQHRIQQLSRGDVALLKGESWLGNEGAGLVHRSPNLTQQKKRLLLTLDF